VKLGPSQDENKTNGREGGGERDRGAHKNRIHTRMFVAEKKPGSLLIT
jgi:hypothetical protein